MNFRLKAKKIVGGYKGFICGDIYGDSTISFIGIVLGRFNLEHQVARDSAKHLACVFMMNEGRSMWNDWVLILKQKKMSMTLKKNLQIRRYIKNLHRIV